MFFACNPRGSLCKQRRESADRLSRSKLTRNRADYSTPKKRKKEPPRPFLSHPLFHAPHQSNWIDLDLSHERRTRSVSPVTAEMRNCEIGSWIIDSVACIVKGIEERFEIFQQFFFFIESIDCTSDLEDMPISHILTSNNSRSFNSLEYIVTSLFDELYFRNDRTSIVQFSFNSKRIPRFFLVGIGSSREERDVYMCIYIYI